MKIVILIMGIALFRCITIPTENGEPMIKKNVSEEITLGIRQEITIDNGTLKIKVKDIVYESILPDPIADTPAGSGVSVYVDLKKDDAIEELTFEDLSEPYNLTLPLNFFRYFIASLMDSYLTQSSVLLYAVSAVCVFSGVTGELKS